MGGGVPGGGCQSIASAAPHRVAQLAFGPVHWLGLVRLADGPWRRKRPVDSRRDRDQLEELFRQWGQHRVVGRAGTGAQHGRRLRAVLELVLGGGVGGGGDQAAAAPRKPTACKEKAGGWLTRSHSCS